MPLFAAAVSPVLCLLGLVQVMAVATAAASRIVQGTRYETAGQLALLAALAVVGGLCGATVRLGPDSAAACAVTLALVTMIAVVDVSPAR